MKCCKCGAELKTGSIYCENCGEAAQIVPDYNILEEDLLASLMEEEQVKNDFSGKTKESSDNKKASRTYSSDSKKRSMKKRLFLTGAALFLILVFVFAGCMTSYDHYVKKGMALDAKEQYREALACYEKAIARNGKKSAGYVLAGKDCCHLKDYKQAEEYLLYAVSLEDGNEDAYKALIALYLETRDFDALEKLHNSVTDAKILKILESSLVTPPSFSVEEGRYFDDVTLELTCEKDYEIYYSDDGSDPAAEGKGILYHEPIVLTEGTTVIRAACKDADGEFSQVISQKYQIAYEKPEPPQVSPSEGDFLLPTTIYVTIPEGCRVYYTWDGSRPTEASARCMGTLEMPEGNNILSLLLIDRHGLCSDVMQCNYRYIPK